MKKTIVVVVVLVVITAVFVVAFSTEPGYRAIGYPIYKMIDSCEAEYKMCVYNCGEGFVSGLCKSGCTVQRSLCRN